VQLIGCSEEELPHRITPQHLRELRKLLPVETLSKFKSPKKKSSHNSVIGLYLTKLVCSFHRDGSFDDVFPDFSREEFETQSTLVEIVFASQRS
jgi:hypothetical protein